MIEYELNDKCKKAAEISGFLVGLFRND